MNTFQTEIKIVQLLKENQALLKTILWKLEKEDNSSNENRLKYEELLKEINSKQ